MRQTRGHYFYYEVWQTSILLKLVQRIKKNQFLIKYRPKYFLTFLLMTFVSRFSTDFPVREKLQISNYD